VSASGRLDQRVGELGVEREAAVATWRVDVVGQMQDTLLDVAVRQIASTSTSDGWRLTSCTLRTVATSACEWGPTTTAVCELTRASSWLVSCSRSSSTWLADVKSVKKSETARFCGPGNAPWRVKWSTKYR
jgi:hypothetical protein